MNETFNTQSITTVGNETMLRSIKARISFVVAHFHPEVSYWLMQKIRSFSPQKKQQSYNFMIKSNRNCKI